MATIVFSFLNLGLLDDVDVDEVVLTIKDILISCFHLWVKGIQTQTAECLVIGEIICTKMMVIINKVDLLEESKRAQLVEKMMKKLKITFQKTKFKEIEMIAVSAKPGGPDGVSEPQGMSELTTKLLDQVRHEKSPLSLVLVYDWSIATNTKLSLHWLILIRISRIYIFALGLYPCQSWFLSPSCFQC